MATPPLKHITLILLLSAIGLAPRAAVAQPSDPLLPADPGSWINSPPLTEHTLEGKAAVLWFFEETCPRCRERWPDLLALAAKYREKPIVFIGVNSGNPWTTVAAYAKENRIDWPIIVDPSRQFEQQAGVGEISLQNIYQACVLTPDGRLQRANSADLAGAADRALAGAKWNVEPEGIPDSLRAVWLAVEFNDFAPSANAIKRAAASRNPEEKAAGEKLLAFIEKTMNEEVAVVKQLDNSGQAWPAYKAYQAFSERFRGYFPPEGAAARIRELAGEEAVKNELTAAKSLETAHKLAANPRTRASAVSRLKSLVEQHGDTEAGREAQQILAQLNLP
jgi:thiol-disulfide isomerase/thioredoxin